LYHGGAQDSHRQVRLKNEVRLKAIPINFPNPDFSTSEREETYGRSLRGEGDGIDELAVDLIPSVIDGLVHRYEATERNFLDTSLPFIVG
jgi:hypothetical protein